MADPTKKVKRKKKKQVKRKSSFSGPAPKGVSEESVYEQLRQDRIKEDLADEEALYQEIIKLKQPTEQDQQNILNQFAKGGKAFGVSEKVGREMQHLKELKRVDAEERLYKDEWGAVKDTSPRPGPSIMEEVAKLTNERAPRLVEPTPQNRELQGYDPNNPNDWVEIGESGVGPTPAPQTFVPDSSRGYGYRRPSGTLKNMEWETLEPQTMIEGMTGIKQQMINNPAQNQDFSFDELQVIEQAMQRAHDPAYSTAAENEERWLGEPASTDFPQGMTNREVRELQAGTHPLAKVQAKGQDPKVEYGPIKVKRKGQKGYTIPATSESDTPTVKFGSITVVPTKKMKRKK